MIGEPQSGGRGLVAGVALVLPPLRGSIVGVNVSRGLTPTAICCRRFATEDSTPGFIGFNNYGCLAAPLTRRFDSPIVAGSNPSALVIMHVTKISSSDSRFSSTCR